MHHALRSAETLRKKLRDRRQSIISQRKALQHLGIVRGSIHRQEKRPGYFVWYLNVASSDCKSGKRERRYIGSRAESRTRSTGRRSTTSSAGSLQPSKMPSVISAPWSGPRSSRPNTRPGGGDAEPQDLADPLSPQN